MSDRPLPGKVYRLTGGADVPALSNGNTWAESEVTNRCLSCGQPTDNPHTCDVCEATEATRQRAERAEARAIIASAEARGFVREPSTSAEAYESYLIADALEARDFLAALEESDRCDTCGALAPCDCRVYLVGPS